MADPRPAPRLLIVTTVASTVSAFLLPYARHYRQRGWRVDVLTAASASLPPDAPFDAIHDAPWSRRLTLRGWVMALQRVRAIVAAHRYDIVHVHTPIAALLTRIALRSRVGHRPAVVYTAHGFHAHAARPWWQNVAFRAVERWAARGTDYLVTLNRHDHTLARIDRLARHDHLVLHPGIGVNPGVYRPADHAARARQRSRFGASASGQYLAVVAEFNHNKRQADVLGALAQLAARGEPLPTVLFLGDGPQRPAVEAAARRYDVAHACRFLGHRQDVPDVVSTCDALVLPSAREGFPRCVLEAMSMRVPVIVSNARGSADLATSGRGLVYPAGDVAALADALSALRRDPDAARTRADRARAWIIAHATTPALLRAHDTLYEAALSGAPLPVERVPVDPIAAAAHLPLPDVRRLLDVSVATLALLLLSPLLLVVALLVRLTLGTPVLFRQTRPGLLGQPFTLWKFRTMADARDVSGRILPDAARLTPFGRALRATSLDELPTLWHVLRGDMALVGPRPLLPEYLAHYSAAQMHRHDVRPGITGWAQIHGRNHTTWAARLAHDLWYVDRASLRLDLHILRRTVGHVLRREGISAPGEVTMPRFDARAAQQHP